MGWFRKNSFTSICLVSALLSLGFGMVLAGKPSDSSWMPAVATWYGDPEGNGSNGGACGYGPLVDTRAYKARATSVSPVLFNNGQGCGACYKVKCLDKSVCSNKVVTVIVTDECPGCSGTHFDLSGAAFSRMAHSGKKEQIRNKGRLDILYRRTPCKYHGTKIGFRVDQGSSAYWFSLLVIFEDGDGDIGSMHIKPASSNKWMPMTHSWGASWFITGQGPLKGPYSVKLVTLSTGKTLIANDVIPENFTPGATYTAHV